MQHQVDIVVNFQEILQNFFYKMLLSLGIKKSLTLYLSKSPNFSDTFKSLLQYLYALPSIKYS